MRRVPDHARNVTDEAYDPRSRFGLYRLCDCTACEGTGKGLIDLNDGYGASRSGRCSDCRGEGRIRQEVASCESPEAVGVALVTLAREGEWLDENGNPCGLGILDREGEKNQRWLISPWQASARNVTDAARTLAKSKKRPTV